MDVLTLEKLPKRVLAELDIETAFMASRVVIAAERLQVFRKLSMKRLPATAIARMLGAHPRYLGYLLDALVSLGLLQKDGNCYCNSAVSEKYFVKERSIYWTRQFSAECVEDFEAFSVLEKALRYGRSCRALVGKKGRNYVELMKKDPERARDFTLMLYDYHQTDADALASKLDLRKFRAVLDVGGGSGVMSIALAKRNPHLRACVLDIEPVRKVAKELIKGAGLSRRISTFVGDIHKNLPRGYDVIMFCDIGRIQKTLLRAAHKSLPQGGMVVLVDSFLSENRTEPLERVLYQLIGSSFGAQTRDEMAHALKISGFRAIRTRNLYKNVWLITGRKTKAQVHQG